MYRRFCLWLLSLLLLPPAASVAQSDILVTQIGPNRTVVRNLPWAVGSGNAINNYIFTPTYGYENVTVFIQLLTGGCSSACPSGTVSLWYAGDPSIVCFSSCSAGYNPWIQSGTTQTYSEAFAVPLAFTFTITGAARLSMNLGYTTGLGINVSVFIIEAQTTASLNSSSGSSQSQFGEFIANGLTNTSYFQNASSAGTFSNSGNTIQFYRFGLTATFRLAHIVIPNFSASGICCIAFALYSVASGGKLVDSGAITTSTSVQTVAVSAILPPGAYYLAVGNTSAASGASTVTVVPSSDTSLTTVINHQIMSFAYASGNVYNGTSMPATVPTLTTLNNIISIPAVVFSSV